MDLGGAWSVDQSELESSITAQANEEMQRKALESEQKRLDKTKAKIATITQRIAHLSDQIADPRTKISQKERLRNTIHELQQTQLRDLNKDLDEIRERMQGETTETAAVLPSQRQPDETQQEYLVRTGKITPFMSKEESVESNSMQSHRELHAPGQIKRSYSETNLSESDAEVHETDDPRLDDGNAAIHRRRLDAWCAQRNAESSTKAYLCPHPDHPDHKIDSDFRVPGEVWASLFEYQRTGVRWLWELYSQKVGGIIGDEMGLGKTIQVSAFLAGLHHSGLLTKPALVVCPATVLHQWVAELHQWWPPLRVVILHSIGTGMDGPNLDNDFDSMDDSVDHDDEPLSKNQKLSLQNVERLCQDVFTTGHVLLTTYQGLKIYRKSIIKRNWAYCCLDEGHKIRNPNSEISLCCKQVKTPYRLILSGTPIQNNLTELWSLYDFVYPGRLGTLPVFQNQFSVPINMGGYANASNIQVQTAYKCAVVLRNLIAPYILRRMKSDVAADLPKKTEQVLFCKLTKTQQLEYRRFLDSEEVSSIMSGKRQVLYGVDILRKICNHPDLVGREVKQTRSDYGDPKKSGKMQVVRALLQLWSSQKHKALLFTQGTQMLDILETDVRNSGFSYMRMDGATPIIQRQHLVDRFNKDPTCLVFLLTTKVGGLGVNLTGADRVIIYDPDWNPSTDIQARERAWRLGQKNEVEIYRLMVAGSIEEKIYHRQIFKQILSNKILKDPKQKRFFKSSDLHDLFTLGSDDRESSRLAKDESIDSIAGVDHKDDYKVTDSQNQPKDDSLLEGIFSKAGVQSSLEYDAVLNASRPDTVIMEREALRVAQQAAAALKQSRKDAQRHEIGTPTWTGRFGAAGKSTSRSSRSILSNLRAKKELETSTKVNTTLNEDNEKLGSYTATLKCIRDYLLTRPSCSAKSGDLIAATNTKLDTEQTVADFRRLLGEICNWNREDAVWELKTDFYDS